MPQASIKTPAEIEIMREGGKILAQILKKTAELVVPGISTGELNKLSEGFFCEFNVLPSFKGYHGYPSALCTSVNEGVVHNIPNFNKILKEGDIISIDAGVFHKGFHTDSCITVAVGVITPKLKIFVDTVKLALFKGIDQVRSGNHIGDISNAIQQTVESVGYSVVQETIGHGIGRKLHEAPEIPNFGQKGKGPELKQGMMLAIEPIIAMGNPSIKTLPNKWDTKTIDGSFVAHFEHTVVVTEKGCEILTK